MGRGCNNLMTWALKELCFLGVSRRGKDLEIVVRMLLWRVGEKTVL